MAERVCVFIDGSNFYNLCKVNLGRVDIKLGAFASWLVNPQRNQVRTYYYNCPMSADSPTEKRTKQEKFFSALDRTPYFETRLGRLVRRDETCRACGARHERWMEKGVDMRIGIDMLSTAARNLYDTAVLVSGDGDLAEAVRAVKELGKHVEVAAFPKGQAHELIRVADLVIDLTPADMDQFFIR